MGISRRSRCTLSLFLYELFFLVAFLHSSGVTGLRPIDADFDLPTKPIAKPIVPKPILTKPDIPTPIVTKPIVPKPVVVKPIDLSNISPNLKFDIVNTAILKEKITVPLPAPPVDGSKKFNDLSEDALKSALPSVLQQFKVPSEKISGLVTKGVPLLNEAVLAIFNERDLESFHNPRRLRRRGILGDIWDWATDVLSDAACGVFAAGALPGYLTAAGLFGVMNPGSGISTSSDQDFFVNPLHGNIVHDAPIKFHFQASFPAGFGSSSGVTMGKQVYIKLRNAPQGTDGDFIRITKLVLHELVHSVQYRNVAWILPAFGTEYLFSYCKAGFSYRTMSMEKDAYDKQEFLNTLLVEDFGRKFFLTWRSKNLRPTLGLPTAKTYTTLATSPTKIGELQFQNGVLQVKDMCFRTFTTAEIAKRTQANCRQKPLCRRDLAKRLPPQQHCKRDLSKRIPPDCGELPECDPEAVRQHNARCTAAKSAWAALDARSFDCSVPPPPPPPPPPAPGCPPTCHIYSKVPLSSKPCRSLEPPIGCDHEFVDDANAQCRAKRAACGV